jgi:hypothetical protein
MPKEERLPTTPSHACQKLLSFADPIRVANQYRHENADGMAQKAEPEID